MADEEHLRRLKQGVESWNTWYRQNSSLYADLHNANLSHTNLRGTNLRSANLSGADLTHADLRGADIDRADLSGANLSGADLRSVNLRGTDLSHADLSHAELQYARFLQNRLDGTNLTEAQIAETTFSDVDLSGVVGLATCRHYGPSVIDHRTLQQSGALPISFLRGVGLPDTLIDYLPSLLNQAIQHYSCFVSYSSKDQEFADRVYADLQNAGVRCWFAPHDLPIGAKILDGIDAAIRLRDKVLLILSEHSIASDWVEDEVKTGFEEERKRGQSVLFPIRLDDAVMKTKEAWAAKLRADRNIGDFRGWKDHDSYKQSFDRVVRDLTISQQAR